MFALFRKIAVAITAAALCLGVLNAPPAQAAEVINITLKKLPRGADLRMAHLDESNTLVDGNTRIRLPEGASLHGKTPYGYVVGLPDPRLVLVTPTKQAVIYEGWFGDARVSSNGKRVAIDAYDGNTTTVRVFALPRAVEVAHRSFRGDRDIVGVEGPNVYLSDQEPIRDRPRYRPTSRWHYPTNRVRQFAKTRATVADLKHGLMAGTGRNGCSVVFRLSAPNRPIWSSCTEWVQAFNPNGRAFATAADITKIPRDYRERIRIRGIGGKAKGTFDLASFESSLYFKFESPTRLTFRIETDEGGATVRAWAHGANRASRLS